MTDIVEDVTNTTTTTQEQSVLDTLVGEGRKYSSPEELAKSRLKADEHIDRIETENKNMLERLAKLEEDAKEAATLQAVLEKLNQRPAEQETNNQGVSSSEDIQGLITKTLEQERAAERAASNRSSVNSSLLKAFNGDAVKAKEFLTGKVQDLGINVDSFRTLTEQSPQAALNLLGINQSQPSKTASPSSFADVNTQSNLSNPNVKNLSYYNNLRKEMGTMKFYANSQLVQEELRNAEQMGKDFYK